MGTFSKPKPDREVTLIEIEARSNLALLKLNHSQEAVTEAQVALRVPNLPEAHFALGSSWLKLGRVDDAIKEFREALRGKLDFAEARLSLA